MPSCICETEHMGGEDYFDGSEITCPAKQVLSRKYQSVCKNQQALFYRYFDNSKFDTNSSLLTHLIKKYGKAYGLSYYTYIFCLSMRCGDSSFIDEANKTKDL